MQGPILDYGTPKAKWRPPLILLWQTFVALSSPWLIVILTWMWSAVAISHFENVYGYDPFRHPDKIRHKHYVTWALDIPLIAGVVAFPLLALVYTIYISLRHREWARLMILIMIVSGAVAFVVFVLEMGEVVMKVSPYPWGDW